MNIGIQIQYFIQRSYMKKQVPAETVEWAQVDYHVQVATGKSSVKLVSVYKFQQNDNKLGEKSSVDAIINLTDFSKDYCRQVIEQRVPLQDVIFYGGHINIHRFANQPYKIFTFLLCKMHLGLAGTSKTPRVQDCNSIMIEPENGDEAFQYNFFLKSHSQYQINYEVSFTISDDKQFKLSEYECNNCQNRPPTIYCSTEKLYFCDECCSDHHKTRLMHTHLLQSIDKINTLQNCKNHNHKYQFYCTRCQKYVCAYCMQKGVHSQSNDHPVKPISYLYDETTQNIEILPKKPLQKIDVLLYNLQVKRKQVDDNYNQIKELVTKQYKRSMQKLEYEVAKKYQILKSCELQLSLLKDKIQWSQSFAIFQRANLKPIHYFKAEVKFESELKKMRVADFQPIFHCKPDIVYEGSVNIGPRQLIQRLNVTGYKQSRNKDEPQNQMKENVLKSIAEKSLLEYDPNAQAPRRGGLSLELQNSNLSFFQVKAR